MNRRVVGIGLAVLVVGPTPAWSGADATSSPATGRTPAVERSSTPPAPRPDIVLLISDDHDYEHLGFMGNTFVRTPALDRLAAAGTVFTQAHLPMSRCRAALATFLSGRWPHQSGIYFNHGQGELAATNALPALLTEAGYATYGEGKFWEGDPRRLGFTAGAGDTKRTFVREGQDDLFRFIDDTPADTPMFVWWAPLLPHTPHDPPERLLALYDWSKMPIPPYVTRPADGGRADLVRRFTDWWKRERLSYAMEAWLDEGVAELVAKLRAAGRYERTLFVFVIDNGWCNGLPAKGTAFEKGLRTPLVFTWPAAIPAGTRRADLVSTLDLYPTILDYAGVPIPETAAGRSLRPAIEGREPGARDAVFGAVYPGHATADDQRPERDVYALYARTPRWKYIYYVREVSRERKLRIFALGADYPSRKAGDEDLYDLARDPYELDDLGADPKHAERRAELRRRCLDWWRSTGGGALPEP